MGKKNNNNHHTICTKSVKNNFIKIKVNETWIP